MQSRPKGIFNVIPYPPPPILTYGKGCLQISKSLNIWLNLLTKQRAQIMFGNLDDFITSDFKRIHSKTIVTFDLKETTTAFNYRSYEGRYTVYKKENNNSLFIKLKIKFKKMHIPDIEYDGLLINFADYRYYLGILKN